MMRESRDLNLRGVSSEREVGERDLKKREAYDAKGAHDKIVGIYTTSERRTKERRSAEPMSTSVTQAERGVIERNPPLTKPRL